MSNERVTDLGESRDGIIMKSVQTTEAYNGTNEQVIVEVSDSDQSGDYVVNLKAKDENVPEEEEDDDSTCESNSTCTVLRQRISAQEERSHSLQKDSTAFQEDQILSICKLPLTSNAHCNLSKEDEDECESLVEINLNQESPLGQTKLNHYNYQEEETSRSSNMFTPYHQSEIIHPQNNNHRIQEQQQHQPQFRGFSESQPKLSFASQRVKEYFESFKSHNGEKLRLYQFFKSIRTELVACLLFTLITSQSLIVCRTHYLGKPSWWPGESNHHLVPNDESRGRQISASGDVAHMTKWSGSNQMTVHLVNGLMMSFTVASLTQIFGHISGCHLIPSVSLALYVKGHISRARLASYLVAQSMGSLMGISLLSLLTTSQVSPENYREMLFLRSQGKYSGQVGEFGSDNNQMEPQRRKRRRRRREASGEIEIDQINLNDIQGSETILLSIAEQQRQQQLDKRIHAEDRTIIANVSTYSHHATGLETSEMSRESAIHVGQKQQDEKLTLQRLPEANGSSSELLAFGAFQIQRAPGVEQLQADGLGQLEGDEKRDSDMALNDRSRVFKHASGMITREPTLLRSLMAATSPSSSPPPPPPPPPPTATPSAAQEADGWSQQGKEQFSRNLIYSELEPSPNLPSEPNEQQTRSLPSTQLAPQSSSAPLRPPPTKLRRRKRNRQQQAAVDIQQQQQQANTKDEGTKLDSRYYINLLQFSLPDSIMSSESIRQCIDKQRGELWNSKNLYEHQHHDIRDSLTARPPVSSQQTQSQLPAAAHSPIALAQLAGMSFNHCLSLSNSSQMFVFQLLATLLVVLAYLVNVDPRRIDLGFKSLSIGLSYFVASLLTIHSGGFFGNPFHLIVLSWLSPASEWQTEWIIYLITPIIGGLFGAMSHEYIDFTSMRNRNKQLHLRRSFYSLDNLQGSGALSGSNNAGEPQIAVEISTINSDHLVVGRQAHKVFPTSRASSLESIGGVSSVLTLVNSSSMSEQQQNGLTGAVGSPGESHGRGGGRKLTSYSRQVRLEQQRVARQLQVAATLANCSNGTSPRQAERNTGASVRRSDFDSNFLISSSPTANLRKINTSGLI